MCNYYMLGYMVEFCRPGHICIDLLLHTICAKSAKYVGHICTQNFASITFEVLKVRILLRLLYYIDISIKK